jgi:hypothetical protein
MHSGGSGLGMGLPQRSQRGGATRPKKKAMRLGDAPISFVCTTFSAQSGHKCRAFDHLPPARLGGLARMAAGHSGASASRATLPRVLLAGLSGLGDATTERAVSPSMCVRCSSSVILASPVKCGSVFLRILLRSAPLRLSISKPNSSAPTARLRSESRGRVSAPFFTTVTRIFCAA